MKKHRPTLDLSCASDVVGCAMDKASAFDIADRERPDLALVDVNLLDGMTGPQIAEKIAADYGAAVIFLTANPEQIPDGYAGAVGAGARDSPQARTAASTNVATKCSVSAAGAGASAGDSRL